MNHLKNEPAEIDKAAYVLATVAYETVLANKETASILEAEGLAYRALTAALNIYAKQLPESSEAQSGEGTPTGSTEVQTTGSQGGDQESEEGIRNPDQTGNGPSRRKKPRHKKSK